MYSSSVFLASHNDLTKKMISWTLLNEETRGEIFDQEIFSVTYVILGQLIYRNRNIKNIFHQPGLNRATKIVWKEKQQRQSNRDFPKKRSIGILGKQKWSITLKEGRQKQCVGKSFPLPGSLIFHLCPALQPKAALLSSPKTCLRELQKKII